MSKIAILVLALSLFACMQYPTKSTQVVDDRPRIAIEVVQIKGAITEYFLDIDGIDYGSINQYLLNENSLRVVAGNHSINIKRNGKVVSRQQVYLSENTTRVIKVIE